MSPTLQMLRIGQYDFTALVGVLIGAAPDIVAMVMADPDFLSAPKWVVWTVRLVGLLIAAQGKSLIVTKALEPEA